MSFPALGALAVSHALCIGAYCPGAAAEERDDVDARGDEHAVAEALGKHELAHQCLEGDDVEVGVWGDRLLLPCSRLPGGGAPAGRRSVVRLLGLPLFLFVGRSRLGLASSGAFVITFSFFSASLSV